MPGTQCKTKVYAGGLWYPKISVGVLCQNANLFNAELKLSTKWSMPKKVNVTVKDRMTIDMTCQQSGKLCKEMKSPFDGSEYILNHNLFKSVGIVAFSVLALRY